MAVMVGTPGAVRTHGLQSRSLTLYPAELRALNRLDYTRVARFCQGLVEAGSVQSSIQKKSKIEKGGSALGWRER